MDKAIPQFSGMNILIDLYGTASVGKSSTLCELITLLKKSPTYRSIQSQELSGNDLWEIFEYNGKTVGVITAGDPGCEWAVDEFLDSCLAHSCNVIFTASRTRGAIFYKVKTFADEHGYMFVETSPLYVRIPNGYQGDDYAPLHTIFATMLTNLI